MEYYLPNLQPEENIYIRDYLMGIINQTLKDNNLPIGERPLGWSDIFTLQLDKTKEEHLNDQVLADPVITRESLYRILKDRLDKKEHFYLYLELSHRTFSISIHGTTLPSIVNTVNQDLEYGSPDSINLRLYCMHDSLVIPIID